MKFIPRSYLISKNQNKYQRNIIESQSENFYNINVSYTGISAVFFYILCFLYIYYTAHKTGKITLNLKDNYGITLSEALEHSEKIGATVLMVTFSALYIGLLSNKGFLIGNDYLRLSIIGANFVLLLGFLLLFLIPPSRNSYKQALLHFILAGIVIIFTIYSNFMISEIYRNEYQENEYTNTLLGLASVSSIFGILVIMIVIFSFFVKLKKRIYEILFSIIGISEIIIIILFGISLLLFSLMPEIPDLDYICQGYVKN